MSGVSYPVSEANRKKLSGCHLTMNCKSCQEIKTEFGAEKARLALKTLGAKASASEIRNHIIALKELGRKFGDYNIQTAKMAIGEGASAADIERYIHTEKLNPENS